MSNLKKIIYSIILCMFFILLSTNNSYAKENNVSNKKVVSLVFDDSGSMAGEKEENANYALQALISMLGKDDELNIVKMSSPYAENVLDISEKTLKQNSIDQIRTWPSNGGTPFETIDTAKNWLIERKSQLNDNAEYWLIIITDGIFATDVSMENYMSEINESFEGLNFNAMLVSIGQDINPDYIKAFKSSSNFYSQEIASADKIIPTMFEISSQINSGVNIQAIEAQKIDNNKIEVDFTLPINKMNIFICKMTQIESLLDENAPYITARAIVSNKEILNNEEVKLYRPIIDKKVDIKSISVYIFEDLKISKGLLGTIENEIPRILSIIKNYLNWNESLLPEEDKYIKQININNSLMLKEVNKIIPTIFL